MDETAVRQLKVAELRTELQKLGLPTGGKKDELVARLLEALPKRVEEPAAPVKPKSGTVTPVPIQDKMAGRAARFGTSMPAPAQDKMTERATRFGITTHNTVSDEDDRVKKRKERFGSVSEDFFDIEKLRARQARFGIVTSSKLAKEDMNAQKVKRMQRFGLSS